MLTKTQYLLSKLKVNFHNVENIIAYTLGLRHNHPDFQMLTHHSVEQNILNKSTNKISLKELFETSILWAVPKKRKTLERRMNKKFGFPHLVWKPFRERKDLETCYTCGHTYQKKHLCGNCYARVKEETTKMQDKIVSELGLSPIDKEVVVLYKGDTQDRSEFKNVRVVEMESERPPWFSKNLLQKTTQKSSDSTDVKPTELG